MSANSFWSLVITALLMGCWLYGTRRVRFYVCCYIALSGIDSLYSLFFKSGNWLHIPTQLFWIALGVYFAFLAPREWQASVKETS